MVIRTVLNAEYWVLSPLGKKYSELSTQNSALNCRGQSLTEFILVTAVLAAVGIFMMQLMIGPDRDSGAIKTVADGARNAVVNDGD